jgi:hypothetical protein
VKLKNPFIHTRHPNGFTRYSLDLGVVDFRVHYWPNEVRDADIHKERQSFISLVVKGNLYEERFSVTDGDKFTQQLCCGGLVVGSLSRTVNAVRIASRQRCAPIIYRMTTNDWHKVSAAAGTITFSVRFGKNKPYAIALKPS